MNNIPLQQGLFEEKKVTALTNEAPTLSQSMQHASNVLNTIFPEQQQRDKEVQKARIALGKTSKELSDEELQAKMSETQYLIQTWLDEFERNMFDGKTLKEVLHEKGGL